MFTARVLFVVSLLLAIAVVPRVSQSSALQTADVELRTIPREYLLDGVVECVHRSTVSAQVHGQVESIHYDLNDYVERGALLVKLKDSEFQARLAQAEAEVQSATAQLKQRQDEYERVEGMFVKKLIAASAMDQTTADVASAQARYDSAIGALKEAREQLGYTEIRAPHSGYVTERHVEVGEIASPGQPLMSGVSLDQLRVLVDVPQSMIPALRKRGKVRVQIPEEGSIETSDITIVPTADRGSNSFKVRVGLPEKAKYLFPGMFLKVSLITGDKKVLVVPKAVVVNRSEVTGVYVLDQGDKIRFRQIRLGRDLGEHVVVLAGLSVGERAALDPYLATVTLKRVALADSGD